MQDVQTCYRHGDRRAGVTCQRCDRPICPDCMRQASVGFHCPECAGGSSAKVIRGAQLLHHHEMPVVTNVLIAMNLAVFVGSLMAGGALDGVSLSDFDINFVLIGAAINNNVPIGVASGEWYRLVTGAFMHAGLIHLAMNMYVLYILGPQIERALGRLEFLAVYCIALLGGSLGVMLLSPFDPTVGASGAIFGLFGAAVVLQHRMGIDPLRSGIGMLIGINLMFTFLIPGISVGGHIGGLIAGALAGVVVLEATERRQPAIAIAGCSILALAFAAGAIWAAQQALTSGQAVLSF